MIVSEFIPKPYKSLLDSGSVAYSSPSNIALVKYWGKKAHQIPANPSISFTLNNCKTLTTIKFKKKTTKGFSFEVYLEGVIQKEFKPKIKQFFQRIEVYLPFLSAYHFTIETSNTFPHSSGIASSASGMSALALCLVQLEQSLNPETTKTFFNRKASFLARLGSGSACRSIEGPLIVWGTHANIIGSSDLVGIKYPYEVHPNFNNFCDTILLVDKGEKQVSSTVGHDLMHGHPFSEQRFAQAHTNMDALIEVLKTGDLTAFINIVEREALTLHSMMMSSDPYFILMKPNTLEIINKIWTFRIKTGLCICFTLDAGANVHVLFPENEANEIREFIKTSLVMHCQNDQFIEDILGEGAQSIKI
jgi:diphosphomevalonate decarboxylase|tara:strand:- start:11 stop:1093 length:1083 start_codon:yes stop_codon:yes gene_type:complete